MSEESALDLNWLVAEALADLIVYDQTKPEIKELKLTCICTALANAKKLERDYIHPLVIQKILQKRLNFLKEATTKADLREIMQPKPPHYNGNQFIPRSKYHIEEEEMLCWMEASLRGPLMTEGFRRYEELFRNCFGASVDEYLKKEKLEELT